MRDADVVDISDHEIERSKIQCLICDRGRWAWMKPGGQCRMLGFARGVRAHVSCDDISPASPKHDKPCEPSELRRELMLPLMLAPSITL